MKTAIFKLLLHVLNTVVKQEGKIPNRTIWCGCSRFSSVAISLRNSTQLYSLHLSHFLQRHLPFWAQDNVSLTLTKLIRNLYKPKTPGENRPTLNVGYCHTVYFWSSTKRHISVQFQLLPWIFVGSTKVKTQYTHFSADWLRRVNSCCRDHGRFGEGQYRATIITATLNRSNCSIHNTCNAAPDIRIRVMDLDINSSYVSKKFCERSRRHQSVR